MKKYLVILTLILLLLPSAAYAVQDWQTKDIPSDVEAGLIVVPDGYNVSLSIDDSPNAEQMRKIIREKMFRDGMNKDQLYAYLTGIYGEKVLAEPPKKGFDLLAWLLPLVATIGGAAVVYFGIGKWAGKARPERNLGVSIDPEYQDKLDEQMKKYL